MFRMTVANFPKRVAGRGSLAKVANMDRIPPKTLSAREAKNRFGYLIDMARQEPISIEKHGRPVVVVMSIEDYERMVAACQNNKEQNDCE
jgi:prevent-host-death family protein